jgi:two-component system sensor histidine kinase DctS
MPFRPNSKDVPRTPTGLPLSSAGWLGVTALGVILLLVGAGFLLAIRTERAERQAQLISDALWVEQTLHFVIENGTQEIDRLAADIRKGLPADNVADQLGVIRRLHPEMARLVYIGGQQGQAISEPATANPVAHAALDADVVAAAFKLGEGKFGPVYREGMDNWRFDFVQPVADGSSQSLIVASFDASDLLSNHIPWWVTRKNQIAIRDSNNRTIASKSAVSGGLDGSSHIIPFEPPGQGLSLVVMPYRAPVRWLSWALPGMIALLASIVGASLLFLQRSVRRRQTAEEQLRSESAFRRSMEDSLTIGMRARDREGRIIYANQAFCDMVGWPREELIGRAPPMPYWDKDHLEETVARHDSILAGDVPKEGFEIRFRHRNGEAFDALIYEAPLHDAGGKHIGWMASILDVTERKRMGELSKTQADELARTARLVSVGEMASTLAHEINQPLTAISTYASGLSGRLERGRVPVAEVRGILDKLSTQARRAGGIIHHLREFTRRSTPRLSVADMRDIVRRTVGFLDADLARNGVSVATHLTDDGCPVRGDEVLLEQVILNLLRNGAEAVRGLPKSRSTIELHVTASAEQVMVTIRDFGPGVPADMRDRLFVPFATSKGDGMGMGLNICRSIVELHRGRIWQEDAEPGCIFHVSIPLAAVETQ